MSLAITGSSQPKTEENPASVPPVSSNSVTEVALPIVAAQATAPTARAKLELETKVDCEKIEKTLGEVEAYFKAKEKDEFNSDVFDKVKKQFLVKFEGQNDSEWGPLDRQKLRYQKACFVLLPWNTQYQIVINSIEGMWKGGSKEFVEFAIFHLPIHGRVSPHFDFKKDMTSIFVAACYLQLYGKAEECLKVMPQISLHTGVKLRNEMVPCISYVPPGQLRTWCQHGVINEEVISFANHFRTDCKRKWKAQWENHDLYCWLVLSEESEKIELALKAKHSNWHQNNFNLVKNLFRYSSSVIEFPSACSYWKEYFLSLPELMRNIIVGEMADKFCWWRRVLLTDSAREIYTFFLTNCSIANVPVINTLLYLGLYEKAEQCLIKSRELWPDDVFQISFVPSHLLEEWYKKGLLKEEEFNIAKRDLHYRTEIEKVFNQLEKEVSPSDLPNFSRLRGQFLRNFFDVRNKFFSTVLPLLPKDVRCHIEDLCFSTLARAIENDEAVKYGEPHIKLTENSSIISNEIFTTAAYLKCYKQVERCLLSENPKIARFRGKDTPLKYIPHDQLQKWLKEGVLKQEEYEEAAKAREMHERKLKEKDFFAQVRGEAAREFEALAGARGSITLDRIIQLGEEFFVGVVGPNIKPSDEPPNDLSIYFEEIPQEMSWQGIKKTHFMTFDYHHESSDTTEVVFRVAVDVSPSHEFVVSLVKKICERWLPGSRKKRVFLSGNIQGAKQIVATVLNCFVRKKPLNEEVTDVVKSHNWWLQQKEDYYTAALALAILRRDASL